MRYRMEKLEEKFLMWLAWRIPKKLRYWVMIKCGADATTGKYEGTVLPEMTFMDALKRNAYFEQGA